MPWAINYPSNLHSCPYSGPDVSFVNDFTSVLFVAGSDITGLERFALTQVNNPDVDW